MQHKEEIDQHYMDIINMKLKLINQKEEWSNNILFIFIHNWYKTLQISFCFFDPQFLLYHTFALKIIQQLVLFAWRSFCIGFVDNLLRLFQGF